MSDMNTLFEKFEKAAYPERVTLFRQAIGGKEMDGEWAFEMLNLLYGDAAKQNDRSTFNQLVSELQAEAPAAYQAEAGYLLEWQISNDLVDGRFDQIPARISLLAKEVGKLPEIVQDTADKLAYYGQLGLLVQLYKEAWEPLQSSGNIFDWAIEEYAVNATNAIILHYLATADDPRADDPVLLAQLDAFVEFDHEALAEHMTQITGQAQREWSVEDFALPPDAREELPDPVERNLTHLLRNFVHYLYAEVGMPTSRAALAYWPLAGLIYAQVSFDLQQYRPKRKKKGRYPRKKAGLSTYLCPGKSTILDFLNHQLDIITPQHYRAAALVAALPSWFHYLHEMQIIDLSQEQQARQQVTTVLPLLRKLWHSFADPALLDALAAWDRA